MFIAIQDKPLLTLAFVTLLCTHLLAHEARSEAKSFDQAVQKNSQRTDPWQRDPFIGADKKASGSQSAKILVKPERPEINLQGIMKVNDKYFAVINGRVVGVGNRLNGTTIKRISRTAIVVEDETGRNKIDIYKGLVR
jgi:predicted house-cleaning NTP pyrophosphatase (Maf/HAM1 superfamily)